MARKLAVRLYWKLREAARPVPLARMQGSPATPVVGESRRQNLCIDNADDRIHMTCRRPGHCCAYNCAAFDSTTCFPVLSTGSRRGVSLGKTGLTLRAPATRSQEGILGRIGRGLLL